MSVQTTEIETAAQQERLEPHNSATTTTPGSAGVGSSSTQPAMAEVKTLYRRSSQFLGGQIGMFLLGFVSFPILARLFSVAEFGLIALVQNTIAVVTVFSKFGLQHSVQRFYKEHAVCSEPGKLRRYYSSQFMGALAIGAVVTLLFLGALWVVPNQYVSSNLQRLFGYASALIFIRTVQSIITNLLQAQGNAKAYNVLQLGSKAATTAVTVLLLLTWKTTPTVFFVGTIIVELATVLIMLPYLRRQQILALGEFDHDLFRVSIAFGIPMMATEICWLILDAGDRFLVQGYLGAKQLGYYAAAYNFSTYIRESLSTPIGLAFFPICMELWVAKGRERTQAFLSRCMDQFILAGVGLACAVSLTSRDVIQILASPKFMEAHRLLPYLVIGQLISAVAMFQGAGLKIYKRTYTLARTVFLASVLNIVLNIILLPRIGLLGAAIATLAAYIFSTTLFAWESQKLLPLHMEWAAWIRYVLVGIATWACLARVGFANPFVDGVVRGLGSLVLYFGTLCLVDKKVRILAGTVWRTLFMRGAQKLSGAPQLAPLKDER